LIEQKEKAFLSQSLAKIHCDLSVSLDLESSVFASRDFWTEEVIAFFQSMEFKSLLPTAFHAEVKKFEVQPAKSIETLAELDSLIEMISSMDEIVIATDKENILLALGNTFYRIEPRKVDITGFLDFLQKSDIRIVGYNVKEDLKNMFRYKKSLQ
jgi:5'-3' exonuclease